jgi:hypothetical protein
MWGADVEGGPGLGNIIKADFMGKGYFLTVGSSFKRYPISISGPKTLGKEPV